MGDFAAYMLGLNGDPAQPFYLILGTPTNPSQLVAIDDGDSIREYSLTRDPIRSSPLPFFSNEVYQGNFAAGTYHSTNMIVVEPGDFETIRAMQTWVSIEGTGTNSEKRRFRLHGSNLSE